MWDEIKTEKEFVSELIRLEKILDSKRNAKATHTAFTQPWLYAEALGRLCDFNRKADRKDYTGAADTIRMLSESTDMMNDKSILELIKNEVRRRIC